MDKINYTKTLLGQWVKHTRASTMDQTELALRAGTSKNTISRLERAKSINSDTLLTVLDRLELLDPLILAIENEYALVKDYPQRKGIMANNELPNDF